jgi:hypothetical protein
VPALLATQLNLERCPHCNVDTPTLKYWNQQETQDFANSVKRLWRFYQCMRCGNMISAWAPAANQEAKEIYPRPATVEDALPPRAKEYLAQALNSLSSPSGAIMLAASSVDAMLKAKGLKDGSLYSRIDKAAENHLITQEMAAWAHEVRLDANEQRHDDESQPLPDASAARRAVDFVVALGQFMFVLPARISRGIADAKGAG